MTLYTLKVEDGDFVLDPATGRFVEITGLEKARQDARLCLTKDVGPQGDGCGLDQLVGMMPDSAAALRADISRRVRQGFTKLFELESRYQVADRAPEERLIGVGSVRVWTTDRHSYYLLRVDVRTARGIVSVDQTVVTPGG